jgi:DNA replication protein DnaC
VKFDMFLVASAWRSPACELLQCFRPEVLHMVPPAARWCAKHGKLTPPASDPYPLEGYELREAEASAWSYLAPKLGVPSKYRAGFDELQPTAALEVGRTYVEGDDYMCCGVILQGGVGVGKTTTLRAVQRSLELSKARVDDRTTSIAFFDFTTLSRLLLDPDEREDTLQACRNADDLLIDDLGAGYTKIGGFVASLFEEIAIHREARDYPLRASTNLTPRAFRATFGDRVYDRLRGEWGRWIRCGGASMRKKREARA